MSGKGPPLGGRGPLAAPQARGRSRAGYGRRGTGTREQYGRWLPMTREAIASRRAAYAGARDAGMDPWAAAQAAGWDPVSHQRHERWYQYQLAKKGSP
jgi:hypothetical protein